MIIFTCLQHGQPELGIEAQPHEKRALGPGGTTPLPPPTQTEGAERGTPSACPSTPTVSNTHMHAHAHTHTQTHRHTHTHTHTNTHKHTQAHTHTYIHTHTHTYTHKRTHTPPNMLCVGFIYTKRLKNPMKWGF